MKKSMVYLQIQGGDGSVEDLREVTREVEVYSLLFHIPDLDDWDLQPSIKYGVRYKPMEKIEACWFADEDLFLESLPLKKGNSRINAKIIVHRCQGPEIAINWPGESKGAKEDFVLALHKDMSGDEFITPSFISKDKENTVVSLSPVKIPEEQKAHLRQSGGQERGCWTLVFPDFPRKEGEDIVFRAKNEKDLINERQANIVNCQPVMMEILSKNYSLRLPTQQPSVFVAIPLMTKTRPCWTVSLKSKSDAGLTSEKKLNLKKFDPWLNILEWDLPKGFTSDDSSIEIHETRGSCPNPVKVVPWLAQWIGRLVINPGRLTSSVSLGNTSAEDQFIIIKLFKKDGFDDESSEDEQHFMKNAGVIDDSGKGTVLRLRNAQNEGK